MAKNGTIAYVSRLPKCDIHNGQHDAKYDAAIVQGNPPRRVWANVCEDAFKTFAGELGLGKGQELVVGEAPVKTSDEINAEVKAAVEANDMDAFEEAVGDRDPMEFL